MLFNSYSFIAFLIVVLIFYYLIRSWKVRKAFLLFASYLFYAAWNPPFVMLLWISTLTDWILAGRIERASKKSRRNLFLFLSLLVNLGMLCFFKYGGFLLENFKVLLNMLGWEVEFASPSIILPVGISFYTFQTLSYTLDVYLGKTRPWDSFLDYALYVTFFPQLVAGPILRAVDFLPQCRQARSFSLSYFGWGVCLIILGLFEKIAIADGLLAPMVEKVYDTNRLPDFISAWTATLAFSGQIFCDFDGYSTCAIGVALCLGFELPDNFHFPYAAVGFSDFWRRWHITLSTWLRDYLYIQLGGNRQGLLRTFVNLMITMLLGGLWHGASWTFVAWGGLHGIYLIIERMLKSLFRIDLTGKTVVNLFLAVLTYIAVCFAWVFFRADSFGEAFCIIKAMLGFADPDAFVLYRKYLILQTFLVIFVLLIWQWKLRHTRFETMFARWPWWFKSAFICALILGIIFLSGEDRAFIYFQF